MLIGWLKIPIVETKNGPKNTFVSIIVAVRNEEKNVGELIQCIENQTYRKYLFELIIVNDHSDDGTLAVLNKLKETVTIDLKIIDLIEDEPSKSGKKQAISKGIALSKGKLIVTTDGDCMMGPQWIEKIVSYYESTNFKFISGPVTFHSNSFFDSLQIVEFASLVGSGASSIQLGSPNMCNGANIAYEKNAYLAVNGFEGYENIPSGDDEFLMHKISAKFPNQIGFLKEKDALVKTHSQPNLTAFIHQRKRWASKWNQYLNIRNSILALFIFFVNLFFVAAIILAFFGHSSAFLGTALLLKVFIEWIFIGAILWFLDYSNKILFIPLVQIIYPFYIVYTAINSTSKSYIWKGRVY